MVVEVVVVIGCDVVVIVNSFVFVVDGELVLVMISGGYWVDFVVLMWSMGVEEVMMVLVFVVWLVIG